MKKPSILALAAVLAVVSVWLHREFLRGTFDPVERRFVAWLAANGDTAPALPPLTLVLYDTEASALAGTPQMAVQDGALFARAAAKLGAVAAGVEGLAGHPSRLLEAAGRMPLFGGFVAENPPGQGWSAGEGSVSPDWGELPGLAVSAPSRFPSGFFAAPAGVSGPRSIAFVARNAGQPVPSFLALTWAAAGAVPANEIGAAPGWVSARERSVPLDRSGASWFFPDNTVPVMGMNELLVVAEKFERQGGASPLRGRVLVLCRATAEVVRVSAGSGEENLTPAELWAQSWPALQQGSFFVPVGWWYPPVLALSALLLGWGGARRRTFALPGLAMLFVFLLLALGAFHSSGLLLPFVPSAATLVAGLLLGRFFTSPREVRPP